MIDAFLLCTYDDDRYVAFTAVFVLPCRDHNNILSCFPTCIHQWDHCAPTNPYDNNINTINIRLLYYMIIIFIFRQSFLVET